MNLLTWTWWLSHFWLLLGFFHYVMLSNLLRILLLNNIFNCSILNFNRQKWVANKAHIVLLEADFLDDSFASWGNFSDQFVCEYLNEIIKLRVKLCLKYNLPLPPCLLASHTTPSRLPLLFPHPDLVGALSRCDRIVEWTCTFIFGLWKLHWHSWTSWTFFDSLI